MEGIKLNEPNELNKLYKLNKPNEAWRRPLRKEMRLFLRSCW